MSSSKAAGKWKAVDESDLDNMEIVDEALPKQKRGKINITVKYSGVNSYERCKHLNIKCVAK